ncbi:hypothetical protein [Brucella anthropi]|uniref:hypothetical protein n=1 Tax=Brucella anthropi TaxID=529 RepID=UPI00384E958C
MASKELIEKVAQEICKGVCGDDSWEGVYPHRIDSYRNGAKAAISTILAALLEPTEAMLKEAHKAEDESAVHNYGSLPSATDYWDFMLAASALGEQSDG